MMMDNKLNRLKERMDRTVLKEGLMDQGEKNRIINAAVNGKEKPKKYYLAHILSTVLFFSVFLFLGSLIYDKMFPSNTNNAQTPKQRESVVEQTNPNLQDKEHFSEDLTENPYIVMDGYYYRKTREIVSPEQLGTQVGEVKRIGDWAIKRTGDSNEIPPGPIYSIKGKEQDYIAGKGVAYINEQNVEAYLVFKKVDKVETTNTDHILSAKGDSEETGIAFENIKKKIGSLYGFVGTNSRTQLSSVFYSEGPTVSLIYQVPEGDDTTDKNFDVIQGVIFIEQYHKGTKNTKTRFIKPEPYVKEKDSNGNYTGELLEVEWEKPRLIESFDLNGVKWSLYKDTYYDDYVVLGHTKEYNFEITTQGNFSLETIKELLKFYKRVD